MPTAEQAQKDRDDCKDAFQEWKKTPTCRNMLMVLPEASLNIAFYWGFMAASANGRGESIFAGPKKKAPRGKGHGK